MKSIWDDNEELIKSMRKATNTLHLHFNIERFLLKSLRKEKLHLARTKVLSVSAAKSLE